MDPITKDYPELSPYQFASNSPIENIDIDGLEKYIIHYRPNNGQDNIIKVETDYSIKYSSITFGGVPIKPKVVQYIKEDKNGKVLSITGEIPLKNYGSTIYVGPFNPKTSSQQYRYDYPAVNSLDAAAKAHDLAYDKVPTEGFKGAIWDLETIKADRQLVSEAKNVIRMYYANTIDPVNKQKISDETLDAANGVVSLFSKIIAEKSLRIKANSAVKSLKSSFENLVSVIKEGLKGLDNLDKIRPH